jgi:hypothetical protein
MSKVLLSGMQEKIHFFPFKDIYVAIILSSSGQD